MLLGSSKLGKELVIAAKRLGNQFIAYLANHRRKHPLQKNSFKGSKHDDGQISFFNERVNSQENIKYG